MESLNTSSTSDDSKKLSVLHQVVLEGDTVKASEYCKKIKTDNISIIDAFNDHGFTPLHIAIQNKNDELVELLLENGANPSKLTAEGDSPVVLAVKYNAVTILPKLIEENANLNLCDAQGNSALKIATDLNLQDIVEILTEHGAFIITQKNKDSENKGYNSNQTEDYLQQILLFLDKYIKDTKCKKSFTKFFNELLVCTHEYVQKNSFAVAELQKTLESKIIKIFNRLQNIANDTDKLEKKFALNMARKIISAFDDVAKMYLLSRGDNDTVLLMSKAESLIEEKVVNAQNQADLEPKNNIKTKISQNTIEEIKTSKDWYTGNNYKNFQDFLNINRSNNSNIRYLQFSEIVKEQILARNNNHDVELVDFITVRPHHPRSVTEVESILKLSQARLKEESAFYVNDDSLKQVEDFLLTIADRSDKEIQPSESAKIDKLLRPGKKEKIHIIVFPNTRYEELWADLSAEAFATGATIHSFNYQESVVHRNDLVYAGIAAVNKILDNGVCMDKLIIQGYGNGAVVAKEVRAQFEKRSVHLTGVDFNYESLQEVDHRYYCFSPQAKIDKECPTEIKNILMRILGYGKDVSYSDTSLLSDASTKISPFQLLNMFMKAHQKLLHQVSKYKNPTSLKERVDAIIGLTDKDLL